MVRFSDDEKGTAISKAKAYLVKHGFNKDLEATKPVGLRVLGVVDFLRTRGNCVRLPEVPGIDGFPGADPQRWAAQPAGAVLARRL
jgi:hypothetical protein